MYFYLYLNGSYLFYNYHNLDKKKILRLSQPWLQWNASLYCVYKIVL